MNFLTIIYSQNKTFEYQKNQMRQQIGSTSSIHYQKFTIRRYTKSKGFKIEDEIMRFEIKYTKMQN
jgi:hypothetical protein